MGPGGPGVELGRQAEVPTAPPLPPAPDRPYPHPPYRPATSGKEARANEQTVPPKELWPQLSELMSAIQIDEYLDIRDPWFI